MAALIRGRLLDERVRLPVVAGTIHLVTEAGRVLQTLATNEQGRFALRVRAPGSYLVRAERIGYADRESERIAVTAGDTVDIELFLVPAPLLVDSVLVNSRRPARPLRPAEQLLYGRLLDDRTSEPIPQGLIRLVRPDGSRAATGLSDLEGRFWLVSPLPGTYRLQAERIGYRTAESTELQLVLGDSIGVDFYLSTEAVLLEPITVTASARPWWNFLRRYAQFARSGFGEFMTRDSIAKFEGWVATTGDMLMLNIRAVRGVDSGSSLSSWGRVWLRGGCLPAYYLNGMRVPYLAVAPLGPSQLEAVEVYVSPTIPAELNARFPCGVVAYWTRVSPSERQLRRTVWTGLGVGAALGLILLLVR